MLWLEFCCCLKYNYVKGVRFNADMIEQNVINVVSEKSGESVYLSCY